ncbi:MAG: hypothetical protein QMC93_02520 [Patescibacteria group bacterium]|nr:hypothetical protein [Patescibacteria group bacterium]
MGKKWEEKELKLLETLYKKAGYSDTKVAAKLQRSLASVIYSRLYKVNPPIKKTKRGRPPGSRRSFLWQVLPSLLEKGLPQGITLREIGERFGVSRQWVSYVASQLQLGVKIKRPPQWYASRRGVPQLGDKKLMERLIDECGGNLNEVARKLGIPSASLMAQLARLGL